VGVPRIVRLSAFDPSDSGTYLHGHLLSVADYIAAHVRPANNGLLGFPIKANLDISRRICFDGAVLVMAGEAYG
jgi:hypothetical protein